MVDSVLPEQAVLADARMCSWWRENLTNESYSVVKVPEKATNPSTGCTHIQAEGLDRNMKSCYNNSHDIAVSLNQQMRVTSG